MADVRALLRQQRAARRVEHPHASYSDAGKLVCTVCNDQVKTESLWDGHLRSAAHRQRLQNIHQTSTKNGSNGYAGFVDQGAEATGPTNKRKLADSDEDMADADDTISRRKRTKPEGSPTEHSQQETRTPAKRDDSSKPITPPLTRRTSGTPTAGVEMQIASRPATPGPGGTGTPKATTPRAAPVGRSPLIPDEATTSQQDSIRGTRPGTPPAPTTTTTTTTTTAAAPAVPVDEDEWAAFEADLVHTTTTEQKAAHKPTAAAIALDNSDAVISAPVMTAAELAAKSEEEERAKRRALADMQLEDEKEEATRALENEFEVMEELEMRARRLRERREALRVRSNGGGGGAAVVGAVAASVGGKGVGAGAAVGKGGSGVAAGGKENVDVDVDVDVEEEEEDEEDDEDDWDGFRFRA